MYRFMAINTEVQDTKCSSMYSFSNINRVSNIVKQSQECGTWLQREETGYCGQAALRDHGRTPAPALASENWGLTKFLQMLVAKKWIE